MFQRLRILRLKNLKISSVSTTLRPRRQPLGLASLSAPKAGFETVCPKQSIPPKPIRQLDQYLQTDGEPETMTENYAFTLMKINTFAFSRQPIYIFFNGLNCSSLHVYRPVWLGTVSVNIYKGKPLSKSITAVSQDRTYI